jgi:hypothetical protein
MNGSSHRLVANLALACLNGKQRGILFPRWGGIEAGANLSDEFRIMWEPVEAGSKAKQLVHRCYVDSDNPKDHGCMTRALDHAEGSIGFINDYLAGELEGAYTEDEFLENLGMFLGIACHHICDLCSPVHVGHKIDYKSLGYKSFARFHGRVERDLERLSKQVSLKLRKPKSVKFTNEYFWGIAQETHDKVFLRLEDAYTSKAKEILSELASSSVSLAVNHTVDTWHTIISATKMQDRDWSMQPLL